MTGDWEVMNVEWNDSSIGADKVEITERLTFYVSCKCDIFVVDVAGFPMHMSTLSSNTCC